MSNDESNDHKRPRSASSADDEAEKRKEQRTSSNETFTLALCLCNEFLDWYNDDLDVEGEEHRRLDWYDRVPDKFRSDASLWILLKRYGNPDLAYPFCRGFGCAHDKDFLKEAIKKDPAVLKYAPPVLRDDPEIIEYAVKVGSRFYCAPWYGNLLQFASDRLRNDKEFLKKMLLQQGRQLKYLSPEHRDDPALVLAAMQEEHVNFKYASERLLFDKEFIAKAMAIELECFFLIPQKLWKDDFDFVCELLSRHKHLRECFTYRNYRFPDFLSRDMSLHIVQLDGSMISSLPDAFKTDPEIVLGAIKTCWTALQYASEELRSSISFVRKAMDVSCDASKSFQYVSETHKADRNFLLESAQRGVVSMYHVPRVFWRDEEVVRAVLQNRTFYMDHAFADERVIVLEAVKRHEHVLQRASDRLRADPEVVFEAVQFHAHNLGFAHPDLCNNRDIVLAAVQQEGYVLQFASENLKRDVEVVAVAVTNNRMALHHVDDVRVKQNPRVVAALLRSATDDDSVWVPHGVGNQLRQAIIPIQQQHMEAQIPPYSFADGVAEEGEAVRRYVENVWKHSAFQKLWLLKRRLGGNEGLLRRIAEYGMKDEFAAMHQVLHLAPVFSAFAFRGINWNGIPFALRVRESSQ